MASVTVCLLEKTGTKLSVEKCRRAVLGLVRRRQNSNLLKVNSFSRRFDAKTYNNFFDVRLKRDSRGNSKREGKVCLPFVSYF